MWDFETDPEYQKVLDWADEFVRDEYERVHKLGYVEPVDCSGEGPCAYPWAALAAQQDDDIGRGIAMSE